MVERASFSRQQNKVACNFRDVTAHRLFSPISPPAFLLRCALLVPPLCTPLLLLLLLLLRHRQGVSSLGMKSIPPPALRYLDISIALGRSRRCFTILESSAPRLVKRAAAMRVGAATSGTLGIGRRVVRVSRRWRALGLSLLWRG